MNGKKIAFIVVALATVGGIGYFLYKRNKNAVSSVIDNKLVTEDKPVDKQKIIQEAKKQAIIEKGGNVTRLEAVATPIAESIYDAGGRKTYQ